MKIKPIKQQIRNRDVFLSSAIVAITGESPTIEREGNLSIFVHDVTPAVNAAIANYLANGFVPIQDFVAAYKTLRQKMYTARG